MVSLPLAFLGVSNLPINYTGLVLILVGAWPKITSMRFGVCITIHQLPARDLQKHVSAQATEAESGRLPGGLRHVQRKLTSDEGDCHGKCRAHFQDGDRRN